MLNGAYHDMEIALKGQDEDSLSYFYSLFKDQYGLTQCQFRQRHLPDLPPVRL